MMSMTPKQSQLLAYLRSYIDEKGCGPSVDEMRVHCGLASKSGVIRLLDALVERGLIRRMKHRQRAVELIEPLDQINKTDRERAQRILRIMRASGLVITVVDGMSLEADAVENIIISALRAT